MGSSSGWNAVERALLAIKSIADELTVPVVANLKSSTMVRDDYHEFSASTEYLTEDEASQILIGLQENGFYTRLFNGELEFIQAVLNGDFAATIAPSTSECGRAARSKAKAKELCFTKWGLVATSVIQCERSRPTRKSIRPSVLLF